MNLFDIPLGDYIEPGNLRRKFENDRYQREQGPFSREKYNVAGGSWITPLRKQWIDHTSGKNPITDPVYRKELQDIILYPERTGLPMKGV